MRSRAVKSLTFSLSFFAISSVASAGWLVKRRDPAARPIYVGGPPGGVGIMMRQVKGAVEGATAGEAGGADHAG